MGFPVMFFVAAQFLATLEPKTLQAFEAYYKQVDAEMTAKAAGTQPLANRETGIRAHAPGKDIENGMLHDWSATEFLPGVKKAQALAIVRDFERHPSIYPEVIAAKLLSRDGNRSMGYHRLRKKKVIEVTLDVTYQVDVLPSPANRYASRSVSTEVVEVEKAGTPEERRLTGGKDHGFLWRLNSFWIMEETPEGLWLECRSISLTRDTPFGLGWVIRPIVKDLPKESLENLFAATKKAILAGK